MSTRFKIYTEFKATDKVTMKVKKMTRSIRKLGVTAEIAGRKFSRKLNSAAGSFKSGAISAGIGLTAIGTGMANVITTGATFEKTMVQAAAKARIFNKQDLRFLALRKKALSAAGSTEFTQIEAAQGLRWLLAGGFNTGSAMSSLSGVMDFATATQLELGEAADVATMALGALGMRSSNQATLVKNLAVISDMLLMVDTSTKATVAGLAETISMGASSMVDAKQSLKSTATLMGLLANAGIQGTRAGTALKRISTSIFSKSNEAMLKGMNVETEVMIKGVKRMKQIPAILSDVSKAMAIGGFTDKQKFQVIAKLFGMIGKVGATGIIRGMASDLSRLNDSFDTMTGITKKAADAIRDTLWGKFLLLTSAIAGVKTESAALAEGAIVKVIERMTQWINKNRAWIAQDVGGTIKYVADNLELISKAITGIGMVYGVLVTLKVLIWGVNTALAVLGVTLTPITFTVGLIAASIYLLVTNLADLIDKLGTIEEIMDRGVFKNIGMVMRHFTGDAIVPDLSKLAENYPGESKDPQVVGGPTKSAALAGVSGNAELTVRAPEGTSELNLNSIKGMGINLLNSGAL